MRRIQAICEQIDRCACLADVGCDHGYIAEYALENSLCERCVITDISKMSLNKAKRLLKDYIDGGRVTAYHTDGLKGVDEKIDCIVIAGMGGWEIISILEACDFDKIVVQPMKNSCALREYLIKAGSKIIRDYTFYSNGKYYDLIKAEKGADSYSGLELQFGRDNLKDKSPDFLNKIKKELNDIKKYQKKCKNSQNMQELLKRAEMCEGVLYG